MTSEELAKYLCDFKSKKTFGIITELDEKLAKITSMDELKSAAVILKNNRWLSADRMGQVYKRISQLEKAGRGLRE